VADRTRYLLVYDISHPRRLRRVHRVALDFGEPLQYSVFVCDLTDVERTRLRVALHGEIKHDADRVALFDLGPARGRGLRCVEHMGTSRSVTSDEAPRVW
jgi:CRISPR-associated protein Cas2